MYRNSYSLFFWVLLSATSLQAGVGNVPLTVQEAIYPGVSGVARSSEPVSVGVPLADGAAVKVGATGSLPLSLSGATVGQFRCLGTWPSGNCKWVLVDTVVSSLAAGTTGTAISVTDGTGNFGGSNLAVDDGATITVSTGSALFVIKKANFNLIDSAIVNGVTIVSSGTSSGLVLTGPAPGSTTCGPCSTVYSSANDATSTAVIEENGPVKTVIKATGYHKDTAGNAYMGFTVRLAFYTGKSYVRVKAELRNANENITPFDSAYKGFASYEAQLGMAGLGAKAFAFGGRSGSISRAYSGTEDAYLYQAYSTFMEHSDWNSSNLPPQSYSTVLPRSSGAGCSDTWCYPDSSRSDEGYVIQQGTTTLESGTRSQYPAGWGDLTGNSGAGVLAGFYYMSGYWPKSVEFLNGGSTLAMGIWPKRNPHFYNQAWPQYSITDFYLQFHSATLDSPQTSFSNLQYNLVARAPWDYYNSTGVFPYTLPSPAEEDAYYKQIAATANPAISTTSQCCVSDASPYVFRYYAWPATGGGNQADFRWAYQLQFLSRGFTGRYLWAQNFYHHIAEAGLARSDFAGGWRTHPAAEISSNGFPGHVTSANLSLGGLRNWIEDSGEHTHIYGIFDWYYATGDESLKDAIGQGIYDRYLNPSTSNNNGIGIWNGRAVGAQLMAQARLHDYLVSIGDAGNASTVFAIAETVLDKQVRASLTSPGYDAKNGTDKNRGFQWGCCSYVTWDNPPATNGPGGAGTARAAGTFQHSILIEGIYEYLRSRGRSWSGYEDLADLAYGMYSWVRDEMTVPTTSWSPTSNGGGLRYYVAVDQCNATPTCVSAGNALAGAQTNNQTLWFPYFWDDDYTGDTSWTGMFQVLLNGVAASSGTNWAENGIYSVGATVYKVLHPTSRPVLQDIPFTVQSAGTGVYTVTFTPPAGARELKIKWGEKALVPSLQFDPMMTNKFAIDPATHQTWWSAHNVANEPAPTPSVAQSVTISTGIGGLTGDNFSVKAYVAGPVAPTTPRALQAVSGNGQSGTVGTTLPAPFVVTVTDSNGAPVSGYSVVFAVASGAGTLSATQTVTNASGQASTYLTLGASAGTVAVTATAAGLSGSPVTFSATASTTVVQAANLALASGNNQSGTAGQALAAPLVVTVTSSGGTPVSGVAVTFTVTGGGGGLSATQVSTDAQGQASSVLTLGSAPGANTVTAGSGTLTGSPVTFTATANAAATSTAAWVKTKWALPMPYFRGYNRLVYDPVAKTTLLAASENATMIYSNSYWAYDSTLHTWTQKTASGVAGACVLPLGSNPPNHPANRHPYHELAYDTARGKMYLFSGVCQGYNFSDMWSYTSSTNTWAQLSPATLPAPRTEGAMTYDAAHDVVVLYGGLAPNPSTDTWQYAPGTNAWSQESTAANPGPIAGHSMVYDSINRKVVLFGGYSVWNGPALNGTWIYDAGTNSWTNPKPPASPPGLYYPPMAFDSKRGLVVLYVDTGTMWAYNVATNQWSQLPVSGGPPPTNVAGAPCPQCLTMSYDEGNDKYILTSQDPSYYTATWELSLGNTLPVPVPPTTPRALQAVSGNGQSGTVGTTLPAPFVVTVTDSNGAPVSGYSVVFAVASGAGTLSATQAVTNASGQASTYLTLGASAGTVAVTATAAGLSGSPVTFSATASTTVVQAANLALASGNDQSGTAGQALAAPLVVTVTSSGGTPVSGVAVTFTVTGGGGGLSATQVSTDAQGQASSVLTLGSAPGANTVTAGSGTLTGSPVTFTATANAAATSTAAWVKTKWALPMPYFRGYNRLVYDPVAKATLFAASENATMIYSNSYWAYDSTLHTWTQKTASGVADACVMPLGSNPPNHPANRYPYHELAYDTARGKMYLFSGVCEGYNFSDMWAYTSSTNTWAQLSPTSLPAPRTEGAMTYDAAHDVVVLYGGLAPNPATDTWQYAPGTNAWSQESTAANPGPIAGHSMVYDSINRKVVLFGGYSVWNGPALNGTWIYDAGTNSWTNPMPPASPPGLYYPPMAFDSKRGLVVVYVDTGTMWAYDVAANQWSQLPVSGGPPPTNVAGSSCPQCLTMSYDEGTDKYILTSEDSSYYTATWELSLQSAMPGCSLASTGVCTARDVQIAIRQVLGLDPCKSADVDANQICNVVDLQLIINKVVGHY